MNADRFLVPLAPLALLTLMLPLRAWAGPQTTTEPDPDQDEFESPEPEDIQDPGESSEPIINGTPATIDDYPMAGALLLGATLDWGGGYEVRALLCSSTLIAPDVVLLAAHCVDDDVLSMSLGRYDDLEMWWSRQADLTDFDGSRTPAWPEDAVEVSDRVRHPSFNINRMSMGIAENYDIGLVFLTEALTSPLGYVPTADEGAQLAEGNPLVVVGWGQQTDDRMPPSGTYGEKMMGESYIAELGVPEFQVGAVESDVRKCHGDSGGPSFMNVTSSSTEPMRVVGITSHAYDTTDCRSKGGVDTRVDAYLTWIDQEMRSRCDDGTRAWCDVPGILSAPEPEPEPDTDVDDTSSPEPDGKNSTGGGGACGCASGSERGGAWLSILALLGLVRASRSRGAGVLR